MKRVPTLILIVIAVGAMVLVVLMNVPRQAGGPDAAAIARNNAGVGHMGRYEYGPARDVFEELVTAYPGWHDARVNLAIATLNRQAEGDNAAAVALLEVVLEEDPEHLGAKYCLGLLRLYLESPVASLPLFQAVAEADPSDPYAAYYTAQSLAQQGMFAEAIPWYERAVEIDPYLRSVYYAMSQSYRRVGRHDEADAALDAFERLEHNPRGRLVEFKYTRMGPRGEAVAIDLGTPAPIRLPEGELFASPVPIMGGLPAPWDWSGRGRVTTADIDGDGDGDLFIEGAINNGDREHNAVLLADGASFILAVEHPLAAVDKVNAALWGDVDNDGRIDVYLCRSGPNMLFTRTEAGGWVDATATAGVAGTGRDTRDGLLYDADHDGDLDVYTVNADGPNELFNNDLDGGFRTLAQELGIAGAATRSHTALAIDVDRDLDLDLIVINGTAPHELFINDRMWHYHVGDLGELADAPIDAIIAADVDANGEEEIYTADDETAGVLRWTKREGGWSVETLAADVPAVNLPWLAAADITGDGRLEIVRSTSLGWHVLGADGGVLAIHEDLDLTVWAAALFAGADPGAGPSLVIVGLEGGPGQFGPGPGRHPFIALDVVGQDNAGQAMRTNASGIGASVAVRSGSQWTMLRTLRSDSGPGQSHGPLLVGLGGASEADFVAIDWPDGVLQTEMRLAAGQRHLLSETQRQMSSCPVIFAWDGAKYVFVSDVLGVGGIGFAVGRDEWAPSRPRESFLMPEGLPAEKDGALALCIGEPMEEACYLDAVRLVAWDLPPGWAMTLDERFAVSGPEPTGAARFYRTRVAPVSAVNDRGEDVFDTIRATDGVAAPVGRLDHRFIGRLAGEHALTVEFAAPLDGADGAPLLVAHGWVEYPYSQTMFSAWQAGATYDAVSIDARDAHGTWTTILESFGYMAGMPREMSVPLDELPAGATALRLRTNQEVYWDELAVVFVEDCPAAVRHDLELTKSELLASGFAHRPPLPQRRPFYDHANRAPLWDTRHQSGFYTRFGQVDELLRATDDALAIFGPGEEVRVSFQAPPNAVPDGWTRRVVLEADGWCKDRDLFTRDGATLGPLPANGSDRNGTEVRERLHEQFNTRYESGG